MLPRSVDKHRYDKHLQILAEFLLSGRKTPAQICRENSVSESALCRWRQQFIERAPKIFGNGSSAVSAEAERLAEEATSPDLGACHDHTQQKDTGAV